MVLTVLRCYRNPGEEAGVEEVEGLMELQNGFQNALF